MSFAAAVAVKPLMGAAAGAGRQIAGCEALLVVAQALPEVARLDIRACMNGTAAVPASARAAVAFFRVWCLVRPPPAHRPPSLCGPRRSSRASPGL